MTTYKVGYLVGSLATASINRKLAKALTRLAPTDLDLSEIPIRDLPLYSYDYDADFPPAARAFKDAIAAIDAVLFVTPEYNRSVPGALKNALDVGSRPYGANAWQGKPGAVVSVSPGAIGGFGANHHLRQSLVFLDVAALPQPEVYVGGAATLFDAAGRLSNDGTRAFLRGFMQAFDRWITTLSETQSPVRERPRATVQ